MDPIMILLLMPNAVFLLMLGAYWMGKRHGHDDGWKERDQLEVGRYEREQLERMRLEHEQKLVKSGALILKSGADLVLPEVQ